MFKLKLRYIFYGLTFVIAVIFTITQIPNTLQKITSKTIKKIGFHSPQLPEPTISLGKISYDKINLDDLGVNTIQSLSASLSPLSFISGKFETLDINGIEIIGSMDINGNIIIDGWEPPDNKQIYIPARQINIKNADLSLLTNHQGLISLQTDITIQPYQDGKSSFQAQYKSQQKYLSLNGNASGIIAADRINSDIEIEMGKINWPIHDIKMTRIHGWANVTLAPKEANYNILSEVRSGGLRFGKTPWQNTSATLNLSPQNKEIYISAKSLGIEGLELSISENNKGSEKFIYAPSQEAWNEYSKIHKVTLQDMQILNTKIELQ